MTTDEAVVEATRAWFTPRPGRPTQAYLPLGASPLVIDFEGEQLAGFLTGGDGPVVLLVHGWASSSVQMGSFVDPLLAAGFRVAGFDHPAHGASSGSQTDVLALGRAVLRVADEIGGVDIVVAHSIGAPATVQAITDGLVLDGIVLIAPGTRLEDAYAAFVERAGLPPLVAAGLRAQIEGRFGAAVWNELRLDEVAETLELPVLIVHDPSDRQAPIEPVRAMAARWRGSRLVEVDGVGHNRVLAAPGVIEDVVVFLRELAGSKV